MILGRKFYSRSTHIVAKELLGKILVHKCGKKILSGRIIETEAYGYRDDSASHAHNGKTDRNYAMFGTVGVAYVYFTYGMHYCVNAVAYAKKNSAGAVLIRSILPMDGVTQMIKNRSRCKNIADGPGKLTQAMSISLDQYDQDLTKSGGLYVLNSDYSKRIIKRQRIGIRNAQDKLWNFTFH
ncbi:MAG: DNA-3-methyladenine glycosylase [Candidatus Nitrosoabyssus spongiisocia]|nr:MAG: DNA-3-methyladenine glycosylase [Nitrosopumilaceae archaeon AB1(1)]